MTNSELELTANWDRALIIDGPINDQLVRSLTPQILKMRHDSPEPITVGIDSPGGSLAALDSLLGLLKGPTQTRTTGSIVTVTTNRAYSAAANLLAFGDYAVAYKHTKILFHDVRFSEIEDVTPSKAKDVAKALQDENDRYALRLADSIIKKLVWVFIDLKKDIEETTTKYPKIYGNYRKILGKFGNPIAGEHFVDIAGFATILFAKLSLSNDGLVTKMMDRLGKWVLLSELANSFPSYRQKGSRRPGLLDGARELNKMLADKPECFTKVEQEAKLLLTLLIAEIADSNTSLVNNLDEATRNFILIQSMNEERHKKSAMRLMMQHSRVFLGPVFENLSEDEKAQSIQKALPYAQLFWLLCVSLCRELFEGEHILEPRDAQLLGLIDEAAGIDTIETRRAWRIRTNQQAKTE